MFRISIAIAAAAALFFLGRITASAQHTGAPAARSTVFYAHNPHSLAGFAENTAITRQMLDALVMAATNQPSPEKAWRSLVAPADRVGIKVSTAGGRYFSSHAGIVEAIASGLESAGISRSRIIVWDRTSDELRVGGFTSQHGYAVRAVDPPRGYDRQAQFSAPALGKLIWGDVLFARKRDGKRLTEAEQLSSTSHLATVLSREVTKIINVPVLSDEAGCGVAGALYNVTVRNVDNWRRFTQYGGAAATSIADLYSDDRIGPKVVLHVMDGLLAQYAGGPRFNPNYTFPHHTIYASKDPVALDATALRLIEGWRKEASLPPIGKRGEWLEAAGQMGLGNFAEERIDLRPVTGAK